MDMTQLLYGGNAPAAPAQPQNLSTGFSAMQQPVDPTVAQMMRPATSPEEVEVRKQGWTEFIQRAASDPNIMRAIGMFGSHILQPKSPGQSSLGRFAEGAMIGRTAYDFGQEAELQRSRQMAKDARDAEAHDVNVASTKASTEGTRARTEAQRVDTQFSQQTLNDRVAKIKTEAQKAELELQRARSQEDIDAIKRKFEAKKAALLADVSDRVVLQSIFAELDKQGIENNLRNAQAASANASAGASGASAQYYGAKAGEQELENADLRNMTPEQRNQYRTKTGPYAATRSGTVGAGEEVYGRLYEQQNPKPIEPEKHADWTARRAKYIEENIGKLRRMDRDRQIIEAMKLYQVDPGTAKSFDEFARNLGLSFTATPGAADATPNPRPNAGAPSRVAPKITTVEQYNALPSGARYEDPNGVIKVKK